VRRGRPVLVAALLAVAPAMAAGCGDDDGAAPAPTSTSGTEAAPTSEAPASSSTGTVAPATFSAAVEAVTAEQLHASWRPGCPHPVEQLRLVRAPHWGFDGAVHEGTIVVDVAVVDEVVQVLEELFDARYPIERMEPVDRYGGSDDASMAANNTSAFNCRPATGSTGWSEHAFGRAIDLNPLQNPYVRGDQVLPPQSAAYVDRSRTDVGVIHEGDPAVVAFARQGWSWGGAWSSLKDYQHFSASGR
jgi:hypothetical protein